MPHFHFHVVLRGDLFEDRDGCNYFDLKSAKVYARRLAIDLGRTGNFAGRPCWWSMASDKRWRISRSTMWLCSHATAARRLRVQTLATPMPIAFRPTFRAAGNDMWFLAPRTTFPHRFAVLDVETCVLRKVLCMCAASDWQKSWA